MEFMVDSNVLIDIATEDPAWFPWSSRALQDCADRSRLVINPIIFAELSCGFQKIEQTDAFLGSEFIREALPWEAAFLAGKVFLQYRRRGGVKSAPLPDFFIGAHAAVTGRGLITRDSRRYRQDFPKLELIFPETA